MSKKKVTSRKSKTQTAASRKTTAKSRSTAGRTTRKKAPDAGKSPSRAKSGTSAARGSAAGTKRRTPSLGRPRIPVDAPLELVFENDSQAREAFRFLQIATVRDLLKFSPDELVQLLTSPAKQTVGRIRRSLAVHNRALNGDESFVVEFKRDQSD